MSELELPEMPFGTEARKSVLLQALQAFVVNLANIGAPFVGITDKRHPASLLLAVWYWSVSLVSSRANSLELR